MWWWTAVIAGLALSILLVVVVVEATPAGPTSALCVLSSALVLVWAVWIGWDLVQPEDDRGLNRTPLPSTGLVDGEFIGEAGLES